MQTLKYVTLFTVTLSCGVLITIAGVYANDYIRYQSFAEVSVPQKRTEQVIALSTVERDQFFSELKQRVVITQDSVLLHATSSPREELPLADEEELVYMDDQIAPSINEDPHSPDPFILAVPFTSQAPDGNWSLPWQETCEEAALVMAKNYFEETPLSLASAKAQMTYLIDHQTDSLGISYHDTDMPTTAMLGEQVYGLTAKIIENPDVELIIENLKLGYPIVVPTVGQQLGNPYFTPPGPPYHVILLIGFDEATREFIAHDPGTRFGEQFRYSYDTVIEANHDWNGSITTVVSGPRRMLVITGIDHARTTN